MQLKFYNNKPSTSSHLLKKCNSQPSIIETAHSSSHSIQYNHHEQYRKQIIKWILSFNKKVGRDTQYIAIHYFNLLLKQNITLLQSNYQQIAICVLLIASKMNQIYPPKLSHLLSKTKKNINKQQIIILQSKLLQYLNYNIAIQSTIYSSIRSILGDEHINKLEQCQKLLRIIISYKQVYYYGQNILAYAVIYLIIPKYIKQLRLSEGHQVKTLAIKIYNIYFQTKKEYQKQKQNKGYIV